MMDMKQRFEIGKKYRFYFNKKTQGVLFGIQKLDAALNVGSYYGAEEIEQGKEIMGMVRFHAARFRVAPTRELKAEKER